MRTRTPAMTFAVAILMAFSGGVAAAAGPGGEWHRLNPGTVNEHERLLCDQTATRLTCTYSKLPEPGFHVDGTTGTFRGTNITSTWSCPDWFPRQWCNKVVAVYEGRATYFFEGGGTFRVDQDYVVTSNRGHEVLIQYWIGQFACPWFRTFDEAVAANPDSEFDCIFAP